MKFAKAEKRGWGGGGGANNSEGAFIWINTVINCNSKTIAFTVFCLNMLFTSFWSAISL